MKTVLLVSSLIASPALANDHSIIGQSMRDLEDAVHAEVEFILDNIVDGDIHHGEHPCHGLNLTAEQKTDVQSAVYDMKRAKIAAMAAIQTAELDYQQLVQTAGESFATAAAVDLRLNKGVSDLTAAGTTLRSKILFSIVDEEMRPKAAQCLAFVSKHQKMQKIHEMCRNLKKPPHHPPVERPNPGHPGRPEQPNNPERPERPELPNP